MSGCKRDEIWLEFTEIMPGRVKCSHCNYETSSQAYRMRKHYDEKHGNSMQTIPQKITSFASIDNFVIRTTPEMANSFDLAIGRFFLATNTNFAVAENPHFKQMIDKLHPGYKPPCRKRLGSSILDSIHGNLQSQAAIELKGKNVTISMDGWTNVNGDSILGFCIIFNGKGGDSQTSEYLAEKAEQQILKTENQYKCHIVGMVTDNCAAMVRARMLINKNIIEYGCGAHQLNLLAKDLSSPNVMKRLIQVAKFFRNSNIARSLLKEKLCNKPPLPSDVRWNSSIATLDWYCKNWQKLREIVENDVFARPAHNIEIRKTVNDLSLFQSIDECRKCLNPVAESLDKLQSDMCTIAEGVENWKNLMNEFRSSEYRNWLEKAETRYNQSVHPSWFAANALHPKFLGNNLTASEWTKAISFVEVEFPDAKSDFVNFIGGDNVCLKTAFENFSLSNQPKIKNFMRAQSICSNLPYSLLKMSDVLFALVPSSSGLERLFSTMGFICDSKRNRLNPEKHQKLAFCYKMLKENIYFRYCKIFSNISGY